MLWGHDEDPYLEKVDHDTSVSASEPRANFHSTESRRAHEHTTVHSSFFIYKTTQISTATLCSISTSQTNDLSHFPMNSSKVT